MEVVILIGSFIVSLIIALIINSARNGKTDNIQRIQGRQDSFLSKISPRRADLRASAKADYLNGLIRQTEATVNLDLAPLRMLWEQEKQKAQHENLLTTTAAATESKTDVNTYNQLKLAEGLAQVEVLKVQQLKEIEYEHLEKEHKLQIEGAMYLALKEQRQLEGLMKMFEIFVRNRHSIETGDDPPEVKQRLLGRIDRNIEILDGVMNGNRLLQENNGQDA